MTDDTSSLETFARAFVLSLVAVLLIIHLVVLGWVVWELISP